MAQSYKHYFGGEKQKKNSVFTLYFSGNTSTGLLPGFAKMLCTCLENPLFFPRMTLFYNKSTTLKNFLSFILKQFVQEVSRSHYIYRHRDSCGMLLRLQPHGKSKKLMIKAVSLKHDFHIFNGTVKCTIYYHRYFSLQTTDMSSFIIASICFF